MTDIPDKWPVAAVLVWIATRDRAAFRIPAGKAQPNAPASCIFDRWKDTNSGSSGTSPRPFFETALPDPIPLAERYIRVFRYGTARELRPSEEVAQAAEELLARLNDGRLSAWRGDAEINALTRDYTGVIFTRCRDICFNGADVERGWPAGNKPGPKMGGAADTRVWNEIAVAMLKEGAVANKHGALAEIGRRIIEMGDFKNYASGTVEDAIRHTVKKWRNKNPAS